MIPKSSNRSPDLIKIDNGKVLVNHSFTGFLIKNDIRRYGRYRSTGAVLLIVLMKLEEILLESLCLKKL